MESSDGWRTAPGRLVFIVWVLPDRRERTSRGRARSCPHGLAVHPHSSTWCRTAHGCSKAAARCTHPARRPVAASGKSASTCAPCVADARVRRAACWLKGQWKLLEPTRWSQIVPWVGASSAFWNLQASSTRQPEPIIRNRCPPVNWATWSEIQPGL